jgi:hypothetical protein
MVLGALLKGIVLNDIFLWPPPPQPYCNIRYRELEDMLRGIVIRCLCEISIVESEPPCNIAFVIASKLNAISAEIVGLDLKTFKTKKPDGSEIDA